MRWLRQSARRGRNWRRGLKFWRGGTGRSARGLKGLKALLLGSSEYEACSPRDDDECRKQGNSKYAFRLRRKGVRLFKRSMRKYVRIRTGWKYRKRASDTTARNMEREEPSNYHPVRFRHLPPPDLLDHLPSIPLQTPNFEVWINGLWHDFLIEPTPYLVASAITYLGFILLLGQYYEAAWTVLCFVLRLFVPWDDGTGLEYP